MGLSSLHENLSSLHENLSSLMQPAGGDDLQVREVVGQQLKRQAMARTY
ncbi:MAG: hypothetical protein WA089_18050 [Anaerolineae bacterium]